MMILMTVEYEFEVTHGDVAQAICRPVSFESEEEVC